MAVDPESEIRTTRDHVSEIVEELAYKTDVSARASEAIAASVDAVPGVRAWLKWLPIVAIVLVVVAVVVGVSRRKTNDE